jgi:hypothetical protein
MEGQKQQNFQECSHLEIEDHYSQSTDTLNDLMMMQKSIQEDVYGYDFESMKETLGQLKQFCDMNYHADQDEWREFFNALGGVHSHGSAIWKPWKSAHEEAKNKKFSDLTPEELKELQMEVVDRWHFLFNITLAVGLDAKTLFNYYVAKNKHNIERQQRPGGY